MPSSSIRGVRIVTVTLGTHDFGYKNALHKEDWLYNQLHVPALCKCVWTVTLYTVSPDHDITLQCVPHAWSMSLERQQVTSRTLLTYIICAGTVQKTTCQGKITWITFQFIFFLGRGHLYCSVTFLLPLGWPYKIRTTVWWFTQKPAQHSFPVAWYPWQV